MKKILLTGPPPSTKGGVTIWIKIVLDYLRENKNDNISVTHLAIERSASLTHLLPTYKRLYYSIKDYTKGMISLIKALRKEKYDKVHIISSLGVGTIRDWIYVCITKCFKVKPIVHYHCGTIPETLISNSYLKKLLIFNLKKSYKSIVLDEQSYNAIKELGLKNVVKIGNSFNSEIEQLAQSNIERINNNILFVGHNIREKGIFELVEACSNIDDISLSIYGPQDEKIHNELNIWVKEHGFKGTINFYGRQQQTEIYTAMRKASLFVLPTYTEGFPYVIVEAMASGCPIIATPVGAIEEMLTQGDKILGYLVKPKDMIGLRNQIEYCLANINEAFDIANEAKLKAYSEYSTNAIMKQFIDLWCE